MAVRCKECTFVAKQNDGFCPECGAMYVEPVEIVDDNLVGKALSNISAKPEKKKGGLFSSLFAAKESKEEAPARSHSVSAVPTKASGQLPEGVPRDQIQMRCQSCKELAGIDDHQGFCDHCGAFYVEPFDYVTAESLAAERVAEQAGIEKYKTVKKTFEEMNEVEKAAHLKEKIADVWDQIVKDRYVLNEKANECMQCFTAAGTINSDDQNEVLASMLKQRQHNLKDFEILYREYQQLLEQFTTLHESLLEANRNYAEQAKKAQQVQTAS